jgi:hypothetical protein
MRRVHAPAFCGARPRSLLFGFFVCPFVPRLNGTCPLSLHFLDFTHIRTFLVYPKFPANVNVISERYFVFFMYRLLLSVAENLARTFFAPFHALCGAPPVKKGFPVSAWK